MTLEITKLFLVQQPKLFMNSDDEEIRLYFQSILRRNEKQMVMGVKRFVGSDAHE